MRRTTITLLAGALALIGAAACDDEDDAPEGAPEGFNVSEGVPDCFPDDTPVPDGDAGFGIGDEGSICTFTVTVDAGAADALDDYLAALEDDDWEVVFETPGASFGVTNGDDGLTVGGTELEGATTISVSATDAEVVRNSAPVTTAG